MRTGTVKSIVGSSLTIETASGITASGTTATVTLTSATAIRVQQRATLSAVRVGDRVRIEAGAAGAGPSGTVTATAIRVTDS